MNAILLLTILCLALPSFGTETQVAKKQDKRGILGLGHGGFVGGLGLHGVPLAVGAGYGGYGHQNYLGAVAPAYSLGYAVVAPGYAYSAPIASYGYHAPSVYASGRPGYPAGPTGYGGLGYGGAAGGLGYGGATAAGLGHGAIGAGYGGAGGIGYGAAAGGVGHGARGAAGYGAGGVGYGARGVGLGQHGAGGALGYATGGAGYGSAGAGVGAGAGYGHGW